MYEHKKRFYIDDNVSSFWIGLQVSSWYVPQLRKRMPDLTYDDFLLQILVDRVRQQFRRFRIIETFCIASLWMSHGVQQKLFWNLLSFYEKFLSWVRDYGTISRDLVLYVNLFDF